MNKQINIVQQFNTHVRRFNVWREQKVQNNNIASFSFAHDGGYVPVSQRLLEHTATELAKHRAGRIHIVEQTEPWNAYRDVDGTIGALPFESPKPGMWQFDGQIFYLPRVVN